MGAFFTMLFGKIAAVIAWVGLLWVAIFAAGWQVITDGFAWLFEQVLKVAVTAIGAIDLTGINGSIGNAGTVPAEILNVLGLLGIGTAITLITSAIGIRLVLQLIPFTRLGS